MSKVFYVKLFKVYYCRSIYQIYEDGENGQFTSRIVERGNHRWLGDMFILTEAPEAAKLDEMKGLCKINLSQTDDDNGGKTMGVEYCPNLEIEFS